MVIQIRVTVNAPSYLEQALRTLIQCEEIADVEPAMALTECIEQALANALAESLHMARAPEIQAILREGGSA